jgi:NTE family protein
MASAPKMVGLGLQGGGSHAAFTWGVLDRLLDEVEKGNLSIAAICGTSGGALNGAVCAYGLMDGPKEAKRLLKALWDAVSSKSLWPVEPYRMLLPKDSPERWNVDWSPMAIGLGMAEQICSPYWNPWPGDVIGQVIEEVIPDLDRLNANNRNGPKLFVCAPNVNNTALRIFGTGEITPKTLMASTCYPTLYRAVEIDGAYYWDGGFLGNPALNPLVDCADELLTVLINPLDVDGEPPKTPRQIANRINEVSFNASWVWEMRQIELINQLLSKGVLQGTEYKLKRFHLIRNDRFMEDIGVASKRNPSRDFVYELCDVGRKSADEWTNGSLGI